MLITANCPARVNRCIMTWLGLPHFHFCPFCLFPMTRILVTCGFPDLDFVALFSFFQISVEFFVSIFSPAMSNFVFSLFGSDRFWDQSNFRMPWLLVGATSRQVGFPVLAQQVLATLKWRQMLLVAIILKTLTLSLFWLHKALSEVGKWLLW